MGILKQGFVAVAFVTTLLSSCIAVLASEYRFDITQTGYETSKILADDGFVIDDWKDLNTVSCLIVGSGGFQILADEAVFTSNSVSVFRLLGKPFSSSVGDTPSTR